jgi:ferredoxin-fold anticodon binding domain-containing protein
MGRILQRIYAFQLPEEILNLIGKEVDIVLLNKSVLHGVIFSVTENNIIFRNIVGNKSNIPLLDIAEILFV